MGDRAGAQALPIILVAVALICDAAAQPVDTSITAVVDAAAAYVGKYEEELTSVLADETYTQQIRSQIPSEPGMPRARILKSEAFFMFAPASREWMAIRDVISVDGKPLDDRPDLVAQLRELPAAQIGATFKNYNSRFNIGRAFRNFNEPTLSLLVLDRNHREQFTFNRKGVERAGDATLVRVAFSEKPSPQTFVRDLMLQPVVSAGELLIEAGSGRIRRAVLKMQIHGLRVTLSTTYGPDEKLGIWVPVVFRENYEQGLDPPNPTAKMNTAVSGSYEEILCEAKYANFRRFGVTARIK
jgi:hypothetical protein